ncbi:MAG: hypothetical protein V2A73_05040, partial [Pseudomonadota bacterium]
MHRVLRESAMTIQAKTLRSILLLLLLLFFMIGVGEARAETETQIRDAGANAGTSTGADASDSVPPDQVYIAQDSPRASLAQFLDLCREARSFEAARYLDLPPAKAGRGADLARRLKAVLDRHLWLDLATVSPLSSGKPDDGLPPEVDEIGQIPDPIAGSEPVHLVRHNEEGGGRWLFSRTTVNRIDAWYSRLEHRWLL